MDLTVGRHVVAVLASASLAVPSSVASPPAQDGSLPPVEQILAKVETRIGDVAKRTQLKSLLMRGFPLPDGSLAVMVFGHVKTPCGRIIQRQYHGMRQHEYYRRARAERDTVGRPSCRTAGGRTVYGGGGIYPDIRFPDPEPTPVWLARVGEEELPLQWIGGHLTSSGATYASLDALAAAPRLAPATIAEFRAFAAKRGVPIPEGEDADRRLERYLVVRIAAAKWGDAGRYRIAAALDREIGMAVESFGKAEGILK